MMGEFNLFHPFLPQIALPDAGGIALKNLLAQRTVNVLVLGGASMARRAADIAGSDFQKTGAEPLAGRPAAVDTNRIHPLPFL